MAPVSFQRRFPFRQSTLRLFKAQAVWIALPFFILTLYATADVIREGDQASLLDGALQLSTGANPWHTEFYNYDKQYIAFGLLALVFSVKHWLGMPLSEVYLANLTSCLLLWSGIFAVLNSARPSKLLFLGVICVVTAPSLLLQAPFVSTAALSSGFLFWFAWSLLKDKQQPPIFVSGILAIAAIGARADAVLVIPFLLWLTAPESRLGQLIRNRRNWVVVAAAMLAIVLGKMIYTGEGVDSNRFFFYPSIFASYFVFGLGAAGILFIFCVLATAQQAVYARSLESRLYLGVGTVFMLFPFGFYAAQLLSTRYWFLSLDTLLIFIAAPRGQAIIQQIPVRSLQRAFALVLLLVCLVPVAIGVQFPFLRQPHLTFAYPTLFPTADGVMPMGAYARFLVPRLRQASSEFVDHNQAIWRTAQDATFEVGQDGTVPVLETHLPMFLRLAVTLKGLKSTLIPPQEALNLPFFYAENRSFAKDWIELNNPSGYKSENKVAIQTIRSYPAEYLSDRQLGFGVLKFGTGTKQWSTEMMELNQQFKGNERQQFSANHFFQNNSFVPSSEDAGKTLVFYSPQAFSLLLGDQQTSQRLKSVRSSSSVLETITLKGEDWFGKSLVLDSSAALMDLSVAKSVFPDWMSVGAVKK